MINFSLDEVELRKLDLVRREAQRALDHYDMRSKMYTNDTDLAANMAKILRQALEHR